HARAAAQAADDAAAHAGEASNAAEQATNHAVAAKQFADEATNAVAKAKATHDLVQQVEAEGLTARTNAGVEKAKDLKWQEDQRNAKLASISQQVKDVETQARGLTAEATRPDANTTDIAARARRVAVLTLKTGGAWSRSAAGIALAGDDKKLVEYARTGWTEAAQHDERQSVERLAATSRSDAIAAAARSALDGNDPGKVTEFLANGQYQAAVQDLRVHIAKIISAGGPGVQEAGRATLDSGSVAKYREFITTGQYTAAYQDDRVRAAQLVDSGTPEVASAARIALEGPARQLRSFLQTGQYQAQREDQLAATHAAQIDQMVAEASVVAATAQQNAAEAGQAAATARGAAA
ncbi:ALF repeat-containing protein, partial [Streptomyces sp. NPDC048209]